MIGDAYQVVRRPLLTEKGTIQRDEDNVYLFEVDRRATKDEVRSAVEKIFQVHVEDVNTLIVRGKNRRVKVHTGKTRNYKKAYVRLREGDKIDFYEGV
jgi:large subunit ribosomal protein L23